MPIKKAVFAARKPIDSMEIDRSSTNEIYIIAPAAKPRRTDK
jgi:hypothetical protein